MLASLLTRLGNDPHKSWADFKIGLGVFILGVVLILAGAQYWVWLQLPGLLALVIGFGYAAKGYIGIFSHRFSQTLSQLKDRGGKRN